MWYAILLASLLSSCSIIDYSRSPPLDWPKLKIVRLHDTSLCSLFEVACAKIDFKNGIGYLIASPDAPDWVVEHEMAHLKGYNHIGDSLTTDVWRSQR